MKTFVPSIFILSFLSASCGKNDNIPLGHPEAFCASNPQPMAYCGDFEDSSCFFSVGADSCIGYYTTIINGASYNFSKCSYAASCDSNSYFPCGYVGMSGICDKKYKIKFHFKINSLTDSASLQIKGIVTDYFFTMRNQKFYQSDLNVWKTDSIIVSSLPVTTYHQIGLYFFLTGKEFWLDDVTITISE